RHLESRHGDGPDSHARGRDGSGGAPGPPWHKRLLRWPDHAAPAVRDESVDQPDRAADSLMTLRTGDFLYRDPVTGTPIPVLLDDSTRALPDLGLFTYRLPGTDQPVPALGISPPAVVSPPATSTFINRARVLGGRRVHLLYHLTVSAPTARTWYLSEQDLEADLLYPGSPVYQGIVQQSSGAI